MLEGNSLNPLDLLVLERKRVSAIKEKSMILVGFELTTSGSDHRRSIRLSYEACPTIVIAKMRDNSSVAAVTPGHFNEVKRCKPRLRVFSRVHTTRNGISHGKSYLEYRNNTVLFEFYLLHRTSTMLVDEITWFVAAERTIPFYSHRQ